MTAQVPPDPTSTPPEHGRDEAPPAPGAAPLVLVCIGVTLLAWASAFIVIRAAAPHFHPGALALGRLLVGSAVLGAYLLAIRLIPTRRRPGRPGAAWVAPSSREWLLLAGFGVAWFGVYNIGLNLAEQTLDAGTTAMLVNIGPLLIALGAGVLLREGIPRWLAIGAGVAFVGVLLIGVGQRLRADASAADGAGVLWCLLAAVTYAAGVLLQKPTLRRLPAAQVTWLGCVAGAAVCLPFAGQLVADVRAAPPASVWLVVYLGAVPTALAFSTWAYALSRTPAGRLGVSTYVVPPIAILLGVVVLGEAPTVISVIGGAVCLIGVALSRRRDRRPVR